MSGTTRSMPYISSSGNISPQSTMTISSANSKTVMFLPISPMPPSGMTRRISLDVAGARVTAMSEESQLVVGEGGGIHRPCRGSGHAGVPVEPDVADGPSAVPVD